MGISYSDFSMLVTAKRKKYELAQKPSIPLNSIYKYLFSADL